MGSCVSTTRVELDFGRGRAGSGGDAVRGRMATTTEHLQEATPGGHQGPEPGQLPTPARDVGDSGQPLERRYDRRVTPRLSPALQDEALPMKVPAEFTLLRICQSGCELHGMAEKFWEMRAGRALLDVTSAQ